MDELLAEFIAETSENLSALDTELVRFERNPHDMEILGNIFRVMHTVKGTCGFLDLPRLEAVAHAGENVLGRLRDGELTVEAKTVSLVLRCLDRIRELVAVLEETAAEQQGDDRALIEALNAIVDEADPAATDAPAEDAPQFLPAEPAEDCGDTEFPVEAGAGDDDFVSEDGSGDGQGWFADRLRGFADTTLWVEGEAPAPVGDGKVEAAAPEAVAVDPASDTEVEIIPPRPLPVTTVADAEKELPTPAGGAKESAVAATSIRINVDVVENLMTLVSELVLTRNQLLQLQRSSAEGAFANPINRLSQITSDLQEGVMKTRMQPISNAWSKLPRLVRDVAVANGKEIDLVMIGEDTELDRQVLELVKDPLMHMVRNSADHGVETRAERVAAGKPENARILLEAFHEGGHIIIKISDDGRGLNTARIRQKILAKGLASEAELDAMDERQVQQFIFRAGFSTAEAVTNLSGRGVGMDVVRTNIESLGGAIELWSAPGEGTSFTIKIPLTLAIVSALIVAAGEQRFAVPQINVLELVRTGGNSDHRIERINETRVMRLRERLLPLVSLSRMFGLKPGDGSANGGRTEGNSEDEIVVVAQVGSVIYGIVVDKVFDTEEIVVKPVAPLLRGIRFYSGNTILGDGHVIMILDPNEVAASIVEDTRALQKANDLEKTAKASDGTMLLLIGTGGKALKTVPLSRIARLEMVDLAAIEFANGQRVTQYRGGIMPLVQCEEITDLESRNKVPVLVFHYEDRPVGLVAAEIVDIVEDRLEIKLSSERAGFLGSAIIGGRTTEVLDIDYHLRQAFPAGEVFRSLHAERQAA